MLIISILKWCLLAGEIVLGIPILYLCVLSVAALRETKKHSSVEIRPFTKPYPRFAILVPAHNEEFLLPKLLTSLAHLDYLREYYKVYVVADNCTDRTAEYARATGWVHVYERFDKEKRGKGYALNWLFDRLEEEQLLYDAYIIIDADSIVESTFVMAMASGLQQGAQALQGCNTVLNIAESHSTLLRWIALTLVNHLRPLGRNGIGGSSTLTGNGMCLSRALLDRFPWQAYSITEDYQYYLTLVEQGIRVRYVPKAIVQSHMPTTFREMRTQDVRWEASEGNGSLPMWRLALKLLRSGLRQGNFISLEAMMELLTPPLSLLVSYSILACILSLALLSPLCLVISIGLILGLICYIGSAFFLLPPLRTAYKALLHAPGFMLWKLWVIFVLRREKKSTNEWVRTSRPQ